MLGVPRSHGAVALTVATHPGLGCPAGIIRCAQPARTGCAHCRSAYHADIFARPVGYPAADCTAPGLRRTSLAEIASFVEA